MKINKIELRNFKFHHSLDFEIKQQNCLIYGENGTGKSSIYEAFYSNFYFYKNSKIAKGQIDIREKFRHRDFADEELKVNVLFNTEDELNRSDNDLENKKLLESQTIYFANERVLREITENNFYFIMKNVLIEHFPKVEELMFHSNLEKKLKRLNEDIPRAMYKERIDFDFQLRDKFYEYIPLDEINKILHEDFEEKFEIEFSFKDSFIEDKIFTYPTITMKIKGIDDRGNFQNHFNEAKLKLIGISIYFALAKKYETKSALKLLVLDDFLTSLDMANRKLIVQYILENFKDYQKIILTHNIQFYNLIVRFLKMKNEDSTWDMKNIFLCEDDTVSLINTQSKSYLDDAKKQLLIGEYHSSGNYSRKEFERILNEFKQVLEIGKQEQLKHLLDTLKSISSEHRFFKKPFSILNKISDRYNTISIILNSNDNDSAKIGKVNYEVNQMNQLLENEKCELSNLKDLLNKIEFYKDIVFNPASHSNDEIEIYRKECIGSIKLLEELNIIVDALK